MAPGSSGAHGRLDAVLAVILHPLSQRAGLFSSGPCNVGEPDDFRVPDRVVQREARPAMWNATAALVVEIRSPGDESWAKLPFYAAHGVDEVVTVEPEGQQVAWLARRGGEYVEVDHRAVLDVAVADVVAEITWPLTETE